MARSRLLDRGREWIYLYPQVTAHNARGEPVEVPGDRPIRRRVNGTADRQAISELNGQIVQRVVRVNLRLKRNELGPWAKIVFRGMEWDLSAPPHWSGGASSATEHVSLTLRDRNSLDAKELRDPGPIGA